MSVFLITHVIASDLRVTLKAKKNNEKLKKIHFKC
nr:MAG TPA: hypothetical protein [Caudoviricetes sp.]